MENISEMKEKLGMVHVYTGDGKGKTSAGMGVLIRALGCGLKAKTIQLFKRDTGERSFFENSGFKYLQFQPLHPFFKDYDESELEALKKEFMGFWEHATKDLSEYDVILIDEIGPAIEWNVVDEDFILDFIANKPEKTELVLTGRDIPSSIIDKADYVSEVRKVKHPYDQGILARKGVDY